jgi:integral membrane protein
VPTDRSLLVQYRVLAWTTAVLLLVLVFIGIPLQLAAGEPAVVNVVGTVHGVLYVVYLGTAFRLTRRLRVPRWQMALVLLAGTVPLCAFVAERKMTRRAAEMAGAAAASRGSHSRAGARATRQRWASRRALILHLELLVVAPACILAGWWQATRALSGNGLSWVYSVEWPIFAVIAVIGWWQLLHEDPDAYRRRRQRRADDAEHAELVAGVTSAGNPADAATVRRSSALAATVGFVLVLGFMTLTVVPFDRRSGLLPHRGTVVAAVHSGVGLLLVAGAVWFVAASMQGPRIARLVSWMGLSGLLVAGLGGLMTAGGNGLRLGGMALMFVGGAFAGCIYLMPQLSRSSARKRSGLPAQEERSAAT